MILGVGVETKGSDGGEAVPMVQPVNERTGHSPEGYLMDSSFATRGDITTLERQGIVVYAPARLPRTETSGRTQADTRPGDTTEVAGWRRRMETEAAKETYKERAATAECVNRPGAGLRAAPIDGEGCREGSERAAIGGDHP